ncbi:hypothetical protein GCM10010174_50830 [Kutzneria viridogrisea]|uniref:NlpC/P60 domain-containing protein n=1 Tax=Kutzneria viridogrisea TaxID=47990 RepID=A0ABR6B8Q8_9PSEU|nr:DUF346 domain-containing protein [Kutzneria albida]MBA8923122.1 hypothetical protein [Kutzneria viridogrisea]
MLTGLLATAGLLVSGLSLGTAPATASSVGGQITRDEVLSRAQDWINEHVPYSQSRSWTDANGTYRQDCSGYVSMAWHLPKLPGGGDYSTATITQVTNTIARGDLKPGDALWRRDSSVQHIGLFIAWADAAHTSPVVRQEPEDGKFAEQVTWSASYANTFTPVRYKNIVDGAAPSDPLPGSASYRYNNQQLSFARGADGSLQHYWWIPGEGTRHDSWGGQIVGQPTGFVYGNQQHVFARGVNGTLQHWWWIDDGSGVHFADWGGELTSDPTAVVWGDQQHIFARSKKGTLEHWWWTPQDGLHIADWGGELAGRPTAISYGNQQLIFARGSDNQLHHWWWINDGSGLHYDSWGGSLDGDPAAMVWQNQQLVFARGTDGTLQHYWWMPESGLHHDSWGGQIVGRPAVMVWDNQQLVFARGTDGSLQHYWWISGEGTRHDSWGGKLTDDPSAFAYDNQQHVFAKTTDNSLFHWWWINDGQGTHTISWGGSLG